MSNLVRFAKKLFTMSVVGTTAAWSMGLSLLIPTAAIAVECPELEAGDLFKVPNNSAVYLVNADMQRMYFPHSSVYNTWYSDFSGVIEIPNTCVDNYPNGGGVNFRPGSRLIKTVISPNVFAIGPNNTKHKLPSEEVATALYGANWASLVYDLADVFDANYTQGSALESAMPHNGQLVKTEGGAVHYVKDGKLQTVDGNLGSSTSGDVRTVSQAVFDTLELATESATSASLTSDPAQGGVALGGTTGGTTDTGTTPATDAGTLTVSLSPDTPQGTFAVDNAARVPFTKVNLSASGGDVTINSFKVARMGVPAVDSDFSRINVVTPEGNLLNEAGKALNADHLVTFTEDVVVKSGTTKTYTLVADMTTVTNGNYPTLALYSVDTAANVVGTLPLAGNSVQTNTNVTLGTVTLAEGASVGTVTQQVGKTNVNFANLQITVATQDFQVEKVILYNAGTTGDADVQNWKLTYNNGAVATGVMSSKFLTFDLAGCGDNCKVKKGANKTFAVYGDVISGSSRNINLDVRRTSHVLARDLTNNYYVTPTNNASALTNTVTVSQGLLTVSKTNDVPSGNVPEDTTATALGSWNFKVQGEPITVNTVVFRITTTGSVVPTGLDQLTLFDANGKALIGGTDGVGAASPGYATSTDSFQLPVGDNVLTLKANIDTTPGAGDTVVIAVDMRNTTNFDATGVDSGDTITLNTYALPQDVVSANTITIQTNALRVTTLSTPAARTLAAGSSNVDVAHILLDSSNSSEDIKVTQLILTDTVGAAAFPVDMQNIRLFVDKDGDTYNGVGTEVALSETKSGSTGSSANENFTFNLSGDDQIIIKKGKKVRVRVVVDIAGSAQTGATATHTFSSDTANDVTATGVTTGNTVTEVIDSAAGQALTVGAAGGQVQVSLDPSNPNAKLFAAGTTGVTLGSFNFLATTTEDVEIDTLLLTMRVSDTSSSSFRDYSLLYLEDENGNNVGSVTPTSTTPLIDLPDDAFVVGVNDSDGAILYVKANLTSVGPQETVTVGGHRLGFNIAAAGSIVGKGNQSGSGSTEFLGSTAPNGNTHYMYKSYPSIETLAVDGTLANGTKDLYKFKVTANGGDVDLYKFTFDITTTTANVTSVELVDITDSQEVSLFTNSALASVAYLNVLFDTDSSGTGSGGELRTVSKNKPRTYVLRGTITGTATGAAISTRIGGDTAQFVEISTVLMDGATDVDADANDDFVWSDRSVGGHATTTNDWVNGYLVVGLNSASSTPAVVAK